MREGSEPAASDARSEPWTRSDRARRRRRGDHLLSELRELLEESDVLEASAPALGRLLDVGRVLIVLVHPDSLEVGASWSATGVATREQWLSDAPVSVARLIRNLSAIRWLDDCAASPGAERTDEQMGDLAQLLGAGAIVASRVASARSLLGAVLVVEDGPRAWSDGDLRLIEIAGDEIGIALERARLFKAERKVVAELRELDRHRSEFLSTVAHELRTPLTSVAGYVEMLVEGEAGPLSEPQAEMLAVVARNVGRLRDLIEDLLALSRVEARADEPLRVPVDPAAIVEAVVRSFSPLCAEQSIDLERAVAEVLPPVLGDPDQIEQALVNLVANALKFTPHGGTVRIVVRAGEGGLELAVADTGIGIPPAELESVTERFFRASNATSASIPGTGLGLAIVERIAASHGGALHCSSRLGVGSTFTLVLPSDGDKGSR